MKITYAQNPLNTTIELDEHEIEIFRLKLKLKEYEEMIYSSWFHLNEGKFFNLAEARDELDPDYWVEEDGQENKLNSRVELLLQHYLHELKSSHCGDCICVACSCSKCHAEELLGIDTIKGLGKYSAHKIATAFSVDGIFATAINALENFDPTPTDPKWKELGGYEQYLPRWKEEARQAAEWLKDYEKRHLNSERAPPAAH